MPEPNSLLSLYGRYQTLAENRPGWVAPLRRAPNPAVLSGLAALGPVLGDVQVADDRVRGAGIGADAAAPAGADDADVDLLQGSPLGLLQRSRGKSCRRGRDGAHVSEGGGGAIC